MPLRPFPFPLRIGTDICRVERIAQIIKARDGDDPGRPLRRFLSRILTYPERAYFRQRFGNNDAVFRNLQNASTFLAGRYEMSRSQPLSAADQTVQICSEGSVPQSL